MNSEQIFNNGVAFEQKALELFRFQATHNPVYKRYLALLNCNPATVKSVETIPFLPISFFKQFDIATTTFVPQAIFESSGTTGIATSRHLVKDLFLYQQSFRKTFEQFYGAPEQWCVIGLLPSYLERSASSLVAMVDDFIKESGHPKSGFYLYDFRELADTLKQLENAGQKIWLIGVTYALLDFAEAYPMALHHTTILETGGMKGRKEELLRSEVHRRLQAAFGVPHIHSEYGMTELLSQAYATARGQFHSPPWMKAVLREEDDPFALHTTVEKPMTGALNVIDLANVWSCAFVATDDVGRLYPDGSFEVLGRLDGSDIRGCSLLAV